MGLWNFEAFARACWVGGGNAAAVLLPMERDEENGSDDEDDDDEDGIPDKVLEDPPTVLLRLF